MIATILTSFGTALATGIITFLIQERKLKKDFEKSILSVRTEHMVEQTAKYYLSEEKYVMGEVNRVRQAIIHHDSFPNGFKPTICIYDG